MVTVTLCYPSDLLRSLVLRILSDSKVMSMSGNFALAKTKSSLLGVVRRFLMKASSAVESLSFVRLAGEDFLGDTSEETGAIDSSFACKSRISSKRILSFGSTEASANFFVASELSSECLPAKISCASSRVTPTVLETLEIALKCCSSFGFIVAPLVYASLTRIF